MQNEAALFGSLIEPASPAKMTPQNRKMSERIVASIKKYGSGKCDIDPAKIAVNDCQYSNIDVACLPGCLPAPFHKGIRIWGFLRSTGPISEKALWNEYGQAIEDLAVRTGDACEEMREIVNQAEKTVEGTGMRLISYRPVSYGKTKVGTAMMDVLARYTMIDEMLQEREAYFVLENRHRRQTYLGREANAQADRRDKKRDGLSVDAILWSALQRLTTRQMTKLEELLIKGNGQYQTGRYAEWTAAQLLEKGLRLPDEVETIKAKNGLISGRVRLAENVVFNRKRLLIPGNIPLSIANKIEGARLGDLVQHPWLPQECTADKVKHYDNGSLAIYIAPPHVHFPSGTPARQEISNG